MTDEQDSRRELLKKAAYVAPGDIDLKGCPCVRSERFRAKSKRAAGA
jgi:hypothetical protein